MKKLTLPKPATDLWTPARDIIHEIPTPEEAPHPIRPHIAGGSALAARWNHRASTDIDTVFPGRVSLTDLIENDPRNILERLGGTPDVLDHRIIVIDYPNGSIDLAAIDPGPPLGQADTLVDGRIETVLSNAQILRGKLQRAHDLNARDVFDIAVAAKEDPAALATALTDTPPTSCSGRARATASNPTSSPTRPSTPSTPTATSASRSTSTARTSSSPRPSAPARSRSRPTTGATRLPPSPSPDSLASTRPPWLMPRP